MKRLIAAAVSVVLLGAASALAADFDGSKLLICAPAESFDCAASDVCEKRSPRDVGAPAFMRIDVRKKVVIGPKRTSPIKNVEQTDGQIILQGTELGYGWNMVLNGTSGDFSITLANRGGVFVLFGSCTPL